VPELLSAAERCDLADRVLEMVISPGRRTSNSLLVLIQAILRGHVDALRCSAAECLCPNGRDTFAQRGKYDRWSLTVDRFPVPGSAGGQYVAENVRIAHYSCNSRDGGAISAAGWGLTEEATAARLRGTQGVNRWLATPDGKAMRSHIARLGRAAMPPEALVKGGTRGSCKRWNVDRGQPCRCGTHEVQYA